MSDLSISQLRRLDLTLLLVFLGLLRHRKAVDVAAELGLTQSAISQALKRLRTIFGDELFLRLPHGMEPTAIALALEVPVAQAVESLRGALGRARAFDPASTSGIVRIAALDAAQAVLIPSLPKRLRAAAPNLRLSILPHGRADAIEALIDGQADLSLGFLWQTPDVIQNHLLYTEGYCVVGLPAVLPSAPALTLNSYCQADHILVSPGGDMRGVVDRHLEAVGVSRRVVLAMPGFLPAMAAAAETGAIATLPYRIGATFAAGFGLAVAIPPIEIRRYPVSAFWHRRNALDPRTSWIIDQLVVAVSAWRRDD